jgi:hypothetical protein
VFAFETVVVMLVLTVAYKAVFRAVKVKKRSDVHVHRSLKRELIKVHPRALVVVRADSLRVVVEHDCLVTQPS